DVELVPQIGAVGHLDVGLVTGQGENRGLRADAGGAPAALLEAEVLLVPLAGLVPPAAAQRDVKELAHLKLLLAACTCDPAWYRAIAPRVSAPGRADGTPSPTTSSPLDCA